MIASGIRRLRGGGGGGGLFLGDYEICQNFTRTRLDFPMQVSAEGSGVDSSALGKRGLSPTRAPQKLFCYFNNFHSTYFSENAIDNERKISFILHLISISANNFLNKG